MAYFFYTRSPASLGWGACKTSHKPSVRMAEGREVKIRNLVKIPEEQQTLSLKALSKIYPLTKEI